MKLKTLILWGYVLMGAIIIALSSFSIFFIERLNSASEKILKDNYLSIESANKLIDNLDIIENSQAILLSKKQIEKDISSREYILAKKAFSEYLIKCEGNITETGESEKLKDIRKQFDIYISKIENADTAFSDIKYFNELIPEYKKVKKLCYDLLELNEKAILNKSENSNKISKETELLMLIVAGMSILFVALIIIKAPSTIIQPILELTKKVEGISNKKYSERIEVKSDNEVGALAVSFNKMAEKLSEYEKSNIEKIIVEKKRAEAIVENMRDAIIVLDEKDIVIFANKVSSELLGIEQTELVGRHVDKIAAANNLFKNIIDSRKQNESYKSEDKNKYLRIVNNNKEEFYQKDFTKISYSNTEIIGTIIVLKNVTGFKELDEIKSGFVATVSHELKTPLAAMNMSLRLLQDIRVGELNNEQKKLTSSMKEEVKRLLKMVNELLNLAKLESGGEIYKYQEISLEELVDAAVTPMLMQLEQKNINFDLEIEKGLPKLILDVNKIAWVIINLLNNAVRYTYEGGEIKFKVSRENNFVKFSVSDNGVGIKPEYIDKIFQKFVQVNKENTGNQYKGVGLGLAISKEFIEAHKGVIYVTSEYEKGSEFVFKLPVL